MLDIQIRCLLFIWKSPVKRKNLSDQNNEDKGSKTVNCRKHCVISDQAHLGTGSCFSFLKPSPPVLMSSMLVGNKLNLLGGAQINNVPLFIRISLVLKFYINQKNISESSSPQNTGLFRLLLMHVWLL